MPYQMVWKKARDFVIYRVLGADDTPHRIALGVAVGFFVAWTPTLGFQMMIAITMASLLRANKAVPVPIVWISNPATIIPVYYPNYLVGLWLAGGERRGLDEWRQLLNGFAGSEVGWWTAIQEWWRFTAEIVVPLWVGSCTVGLVLGFVTYVLTWWAVRAYRQRRPRHSRRRDAAAT